MPVALALGLAGNVVAVLALTVTPLRTCSLSHYLTALSVSDTLNLLASLVLWVSLHGWNIYSKVGVCQITSFLLLMSRFLTIWYLLAAHVERVMLHYGRADSKPWCTVFRTKCLILTIFTLSLVAFLHYIWSHVVIWQRGHFTCTTMQESVIHINRLRRVELVLALFLPLLLMAVIDVALVVKLMTMKIRSADSTPSLSSADRRRAGLQARGEHPTRRSTSKDLSLANKAELAALSNPSIANQERQKRGREGKGGGEAARVGAEGEAEWSGDLRQEQWRCTAMVAVAGLVFMGLTLPSAYLRARMNFAGHTGRFPLTLYQLHLMQVFEKVNQFNGVYKVVLYALFLPSFRRAICLLVKAVLRSRCCRPRPPVTTV